MATAIKEDIASETARMQRALETQRASFTAAMPESLSVRTDRIDRAIALLVDHAEDFAKAVSEDFGHRSREQTLMTDIMPSVSALKHAKKHMAAWSRGEKRKPTFPLGLLGAKAEVVYQPKGVVGVVAPWNFPVGMVFVPMAEYDGRDRQPALRLPRLQGCLLYLHRGDERRQAYHACCGG